MQFIGTAEGLALIDVNTRFYGSLPLASACGVNLARGLACGRDGGAPAPQVKRYTVGVTYRWLEADVVAALRGEPSRLRAHRGTGRRAGGRRSLTRRA